MPNGKKNIFHLRLPQHQITEADDKSFDNGLVKESNYLALLLGISKCKTGGAEKPQRQHVAQSSLKLDTFYKKR